VFGKREQTSNTAKVLPQPLTNLGGLLILSVRRDLQHPFDVLQTDLGYVHPLVPPRPVVVDNQMSRDREQPRPEFPQILPAKGVELLASQQQGLLRNVGGVLGIGHTHRDQPTNFT